MLQRSIVGSGSVVVNRLGSGRNVQKHARHGVGPLPPADPPGMLSYLIGRTIRQTVDSGELITLDMIK